MSRLFTRLSPCVRHSSKSDGGSEQRERVKNSSIAAELRDVFVVEIDSLPGQVPCRKHGAT
jgi:hypothetical protein